MICSFCQSENPASAAFCRACGVELGAAVVSSSGETGGADALPGGALLAGTYAVESVLGQGGFGITYRCHDRMLDRRVAIKEFFPSGCHRDESDVQTSRGLTSANFTEARAQFLAEARLLARCHHAGIVGVYTAFEANRTAYMVMELLHGRDLSKLLQARGGRMDEAEAVSFIERAGEALQFVHETGLLHRDIKPDNIIVCDDGRVMLIDFGTAREYVKGQSQGHTIVVTPGYAPLEQYARQAQRGAFTDVYGLAATLYHLLTGNQPPAASDRAMGVQLRPVREFSPQISRGVASGVETALQMEIARRPQSVREFLTLLRAPATASNYNGAAAPIALAPSQNSGAQNDAARSVRSNSAPPQNAASQNALDASAATGKTADYVSPLFAPSANLARQQLLSAMAPDLTAAEKEELDEGEMARQTAAGFSPLFLPTELEARRNMVSGLRPADESLVKLAPSTPFPAPTVSAPKTVLPKTSGTTPLLRSDPFDGYATRNAPVTDNSAQWAFGIVGFIFVGMLFLAASTTTRTAPNYSSSTYSTSPVYSSNSRPYVAPTFMPTAPAISNEEIERRELANLPVIAASSVQTLPGKVISSQGTQQPATWPMLDGEFSPDGQRLAYTDADGVVQVWNMSSRKVVRSLPQSKGHPPVKLLFPREGKNLLVTYRRQGSNENNDQVQAWNLGNGKSLGVLSANPENAWLDAQTVMADGKVLILKWVYINSSDKYGGSSAFLWDPLTGKQTPAPFQTNADADYLALSPDGKQLVSGDRMGRLIWSNARTGAETKTQRTNLTYGDYGTSKFAAGDTSSEHTSDQPLPVDALNFSSDGSALAARNLMQISVYDSQGEEIRTLPIGNSPEFAVSNGGKYLAEGGTEQNGNQPLLWNVSDSTRARLTVPAGRLESLSFSPDGKEVKGLVTTNDRIALVTWKIGAGALVPFAAFAAPQSGLSYTSPSNGGSVLSAANQLIAVPNYESFSVRHFERGLLYTTGTNVSLNDGHTFSPDGRLLGFFLDNGETQVLNALNGAVICSVPSISEPKNSAATNKTSGASRRIERYLIFSADHKMLARKEYSDEKTRIEVWSIRGNPRRLAVFSLAGMVTAMAFSPDNESLICGGFHSSVRWYDIATQKLRGEIRGAVDGYPSKITEPVTQIVAKSPKMTILTNDYKLIRAKIYDVQFKSGFSAKQEAEMSIPFVFWKDLAVVAPDGRFLIAQGASQLHQNETLTPQREINLWNIASGNLVQKLQIDSSVTNSTMEGALPLSVISVAPDFSRISIIFDESKDRQSRVISWQRPTIGKETDRGSN